MTHLLKKVFVFIMVIALIMGTDTQISTLRMYADEFDGDVIENPYAHLFMDENEQGKVTIDDVEEKEEPTKTKITITKNNIKKRLKTSVKSATKQKNKSRKAKIVLKKITNVKGVRYQIKYAANKKFKKSKVKVYKKVKITLKKLKPKKRYYIKARAYARNKAGRKIYGKWTKRKQIKVAKKK